MVIRFNIMTIKHRHQQSIIQSNKTTIHNLSQVLIYNKLFIFGKHDYL